MSQGQSGNFPLDNLSYNLVTILYEKSKGLEAYDKYIQDAGSDQDLAQFFRNAKQQDEERAREALRLLDRYIQH